MPAIRSRTEHWRDCLKKLHERGGALEISIDTGEASSDDSGDSCMNEREGGGAEIVHPNVAAGSDLVWRVKLVTIGEASIVVEQPGAFGASMPLKPGVKLIGAMTIGQNRWMFHTSAIGVKPASEFPGRIGGGSPQHAGFLVLSAPERVERCTRRAFYRISTANLRLPTVQSWPLMDPTSVVAAEAANRAQLRELLEVGPSAGGLTLMADDAAANPDSILLPNVGPMFRSHLVNVSGGGLGLVVGPDDHQAAGSRPSMWLRVDLRPDIPAPLAVTARVAHTHMDSSHNLYLGMAFDFSHSAEHRKFVVDLLGEYINRLQQRQQAQYSKTA